MNFYLQSGKGFAIDHELAEDIDLLDEYVIWATEEDEAPLLTAMEEKYGLLPEKVKYFEYIRHGEIQDLEGFDYDSTYILFDESTEEENLNEWNNLRTILDEHDVIITQGEWSEIG